jgi:alpha,alpha-trehalase
MLYEYYEKSNDIDFVRRLLPTIDREMYFWHNNRTIGLAIGNSSTKQTVYRYCSRSNTPRPESYLDDIHSAANVTVNQRPRFWKNVASGAESGWVGVNVSIIIIS